MQGMRAPAPSRPFPITMTASGLSPEDKSELFPATLSELGSRQEPRLREDAGPELAGAGDGAKLPAVGRWFSGCCRRLLSWLLGSLTGPSTRWLTFWVLEPRTGSPAGRLPWKGKLGEFFICGEFCWLLLLPPALVPVLKLRARLSVFSEQETGNPLLLLGGVRAPLLLLPPTVTVLLRPRLLRTCFSIQARRLVRLLCSDSTIRGQGLHSAMSRAAMAMARPTCSNSSTVYLEGKAGGGGGLARPLSWQAAGMLFTERPVL